MHAFVPGILALAVSLGAVASAAAQPAYSLLIKGGHVLDPKNGRDGVMDVAIADGKIAEVAPSIDAAKAGRIVDAAGPLRRAGAHRPARPRLPRHRAGRLLEQRPGGGAARQPLVPQRPDHAGRRRRRRLAQLQSVQDQHHRHVEDAGPVVHQHRRVGHEGRAGRAGPGRHGRPADGDAHPAAQGPDRRDQGGALQRRRLEPGRPRRRGRHARPRCR